MSDTKNKSNTAIACGNLKTDSEKSISIEYGTYGPAKNDLIIPRKYQRMLAEFGISS